MISQTEKRIIEKKGLPCMKTTGKKRRMETGMKRTIAIFGMILMLVPLASCKKPATLTPEEEYILTTSETYGAMEVSSEKTAYNYLTGEMNMAQDRVGKRCWAVSVNNIQQSWPQSGTSVADVIIECETEGSITRMMALFTDTREIPYIGSVRSLRDQFLEALYPVDPVVVHIGTSIFADKAVSEHGMQTLDGDYEGELIHYNQPRRSQGYAIEYSKYTSGQQIYDIALKHNINDTSQMKIASYFNFSKDGVVVPEGDPATKINFLFSTDKTYDGDFRYDEATQTYLKWQHGDPQIDVGDFLVSPINVQLAFTNVVVLFANIKVIEQSTGLVNVDFQAGGTGYFFTQGVAVPITWSKADYESNFIFLDSAGNDVVFNTGKTMLCIARSTNVDTMVIS